MIMLDFAFLVFFVKNLKVVLIFQPVPYKINLYQEEWETAALVKQVQVILPQSYRSLIENPENIRLVPLLFFFQI